MSSSEEPTSQSGVFLFSAWGICASSNLRIRRNWTLSRPVSVGEPPSWLFVGLVPSRAQQLYSCLACTYVLNGAC